MTRRLPIFAKKELGVVQKCANLLDLKKRYKMNTYLQSSASIQPRTSPQSHILIFSHEPEFGAQKIDQAPYFAACVPIFLRSPGRETPSRPVAPTSMSAPPEPFPQLRRLEVQKCNYLCWQGQSQQNLRILQPFEISKACRAILQPAKQVLRKRLAASGLFANEWTQLMERTTPLQKDIALATAS